MLHSTWRKTTDRKWKAISSRRKLGIPASICRAAKHANCTSAPKRIPRTKLKLYHWINLLGITSGTSKLRLIIGEAFALKLVNGSETLRNKKNCICMIFLLNSQTLIVCFRLNPFSQTWDFPSAFSRIAHCWCCYVMMLLLVCSLCLLCLLVSLHVYAKVESSGSHAKI